MLKNFVSKLGDPTYPRRATNSLVKVYGEWVKLLGAVVLLFADIWLGAQVLQFLGMDGVTSYVISSSTSALQIALFEKSRKLIREKQGWAIVVLVIGWMISIADSLFDGSAAFVKILHMLPSNAKEILAITNPFIWTVFGILTLISFMGERSARMLLSDEVEVNHDGYPSFATTPLSTRMEVAPVIPQPRMGFVQSEATLPEELQNAPRGWAVMPYKTHPGKYIVSGPDALPQVWAPGDSVPWGDLSFGND